LFRKREKGYLIVLLINGISCGMVLQEKGERKRLLFVTLSPPQAPHFVKRWGSSIPKRIMKACHSLLF